jgi:hypothetical protein
MTRQRAPYLESPSQCCVSSTWGHCAVRRRSMDIRRQCRSTVFSLECRCPHRIGHDRRKTTPERECIFFGWTRIGRISSAIQTAKPNHRNGRQRQTSSSAQIAAETGSLWFGIVRPQPPTPRGFAGFSGSILGSGREVSAPRAWVAVGGVWGELVSAVRSLLSRKNTGNFFDFGLL